MGLLWVESLPQLELLELTGQKTIHRSPGFLGKTWQDTQLLSGAFKHTRNESSEHHQYGSSEEARGTDRRTRSVDQLLWSRWFL